MFVLYNRRMTLQNRKEAEGDPLYFGIRPDDLNDERILEIARLYDEVTGGHAIEDIARHPDYGKKIRRIIDGQFRFGSRVTGNSKFEVNSKWTTTGRVVYFTFHPNMSDYEKDRFPALAEEARGLPSQFRDATSRYFEQSGVGIPLK